MSDLFSDTITDSWVTESFTDLVVYLIGDSITDCMIYNTLNQRLSSIFFKLLINGTIYNMKYKAIELIVKQIFDW